MVDGKLGKTSRRMNAWLKADFDHQLESIAQGGGPIFEQIIADWFSYAGRHNGLHCKREEVGAGKRSQLLLLAASSSPGSNVLPARNRTDS